MHNCAYCQVLSASTKQCSGCKSVFYYCDKGCQASDWPNHKPICKMLASKPGATICQLSAVLHPSYKISQIDRFRNLLDEKLFIVDGKARTDFGRMWEDIRYRHPSLKGGTVISFPILMELKKDGGILGINGLESAGSTIGWKNYRFFCAVVELPMKMELVHVKDPEDWTVGWNYCEDTITISRST
jgi:hypothetical protein